MIRVWCFCTLRCRAPSLSHDGFVQAHSLDMSATAFRFAYNLYLLTAHTAIDTLVDACGPDVQTMSLTGQVCRAAFARSRC
jgi:hypothetical protein